MIANKFICIEKTVKKITIAIIFFIKSKRFSFKIGSALEAIGRRLNHDIWISFTANRKYFVEDSNFIDQFPAQNQPFEKLYFQ